MLKKFTAAVFLAALSISSGFAAPNSEDANASSAQAQPQKSFASRLGESIGQASNRASELVMNSFSALDVPYRLGGTSRDTGFDCSGFVRAMFEQTAGLLLPRRAAEQAAATTAIDKSELKPGDLVFFNTLRRSFSHVGIYIGDGKFVHAPRTGSQVRVESMNVSYWQRRFDGARRVFTSEPARATSDAATPTTAAAATNNGGAPRVLNRESPAPSAVRLGGSSNAAQTDRAPAPSPASGDKSI
jgi:hypothetical protein